MNDFYDILGVSRTASRAEIKTAYKRLASQYHPDKNPDPNASAFFSLIKEAYDTLGDDDKRESYDKPAYDALLKHIFGNGPVYKKVHEVNITLEDAYWGCKRPLADVTAEIPAGVYNGSRMALDDTLYKVNILKHTVFKRNKDDLLAELHVDAMEVLAGKPFFLMHLSGEKIHLKLDVAQTGQVLRFEGNGMPNQLTGEYGDLFVQITVKPIDRNALTQPLLDAIIDAYGEEIIQPKVINESKN